MRVGGLQWHLTKTWRGGGDKHRVAQEGRMHGASCLGPLDPRPSPTLTSWLPDSCQLRDSWARHLGHDTLGIEAWPSCQFRTGWLGAQSQSCVSQLLLSMSLRQHEQPLKVQRPVGVRMLVSHCLFAFNNHRGKAPSSPGLQGWATSKIKNRWRLLPIYTI